MRKILTLALVLMMLFVSFSALSASADIISEEDKSSDLSSDDSDPVIDDSKTDDSKLPEKDDSIDAGSQEEDDILSSSDDSTGGFVGCIPTDNMVPVNGTNSSSNGLYNLTVDVYLFSQYLEIQHVSANSIVMSKIGQLGNRHRYKNEFEPDLYFIEVWVLNLSSGQTMHQQATRTITNQDEYASFFFS